MCRKTSEKLLASCQWNHNLKVARSKEWEEAEDLSLKPECAVGERTAAGERTSGCISASLELSESVILMASLRLE